ncbi:hypothetical protein ACFL5O_08410 [Myxococcota bacterium]
MIQIATESALLHGRAHFRGPERQSRSELSQEAAQLLASMGHRGGWHVDLLCEKSRPSVTEVAFAMVQLELARRVEQHGMGLYKPLS